MLVGNKHISKKELLNACSSVESVLAFSDALVPRPLLCIPAVLYNQRYIVAMAVRSLRGLNYSERSLLCQALLENTRQTGTLDGIYDYTDLLRHINADDFERYCKEVQHIAP